MTPLNKLYIIYKNVMKKIKKSKNVSVPLTLYANAV